MTAQSLCRAGSVSVRRQQRRYRVLETIGQIILKIQVDTGYVVWIGVTLWSRGGNPNVLMHTTV
jgi:hypothetical protein